MSEWSYIIAAYSVTWIVLLGTAVYLASRDAGARRAFRVHGGEG